MKNIYPIINLSIRSDFDKQFLLKCLNLKPEYLQIRMKVSDLMDVVTIAREIVKIRDSLNSATKIIVNDSVEAAILSKADGVHLGQSDGDPSLIKEKHPDLIVGYSTHSIQQIEKANEMKIDYIGFGPVYMTDTKKDHERTVLEFVADAVEHTVHPIVFIGGINKKNIEDLPCGKNVYYALISGLSDFLKN